MIQKLIMVSLLLTCTNYIFGQTQTNAGAQTKNSSIFSEYNKFSDEKNTNLDSGKVIVTMFSLDCDDCMETAKKIGELKKSLKLPQVYILFLGVEEQVEDFFSVAQCRFPYKILDPSTFFSLLDAPYPPRVCLLKEGKITADFKAGNEFTKEKLQNVILN